MKRSSSSHSTTRSLSLLGASFSRVRPARTKRSWWSLKVADFLFFNALRVAIISAEWAGRPIRETNRMRHIQWVQAKSHEWKHRYKAETGSLRGRIRELETKEHQARCDLMDALSWLEVWVENGAPTEAERDVVKEFVDHQYLQYPQQKAAL
jgi:hypothetical protein